MTGLHVVHVYDGHERVYGGRGGSVPAVVWNLARHTASAGHDVTVVERKWHGTEVVAEYEGVRFRRLPLRTGADRPWEDIPYEMVQSPIGALRLLVDRTNFAVRAFRLLRSLDYDVIHVHLPFAANILATTAPGLRSRLVYTAHIGETEQRVSEPRFSPDVHLARRTARTIVLNRTMRDAFAARGVDPSRLTVIPNGVDLGRFEDWETETPVAEQYDLGDEVVALFVGTVTPRKGVLELVQAVAELPSSVEATFIVAGTDDLDPAYTQEVREAIRAAGLDHVVRLLGFVPEDELLALYERADVFVLPTYQEGSSIAVVEALAAGLPVVSTQIEGVSQLVEHETHGLLVEPGDVDGLAANLERILTDANERNRMRAAAEERASELAWPRIIDDVVSVYEEVTA